MSLELLSEIGMYEFFESGIRGGMSVISNRYKVANNPRLPGYQENRQDSSLIYIDANGLYSWAMTQPLPVGDFRWIPGECLTQEILKLEYFFSNSGKGLILEVDLDYPDNLHDLHNDYPLAPIKSAIELEWLSPYTRNLANRLKGHYKTKKLIATLHGRKNYVLHYRNLELYLSLGMKLVKVHRAIEFQNGRG